MTNYEEYKMPFNLIRQALWLFRRKPHGEQQITYDPDSDRPFKVRKKHRTSKSDPFGANERPVAEFKDGEQTRSWSWKK